jgi:hypothetical protein
MVSCIKLDLKHEKKENESGRTGSLLFSNRPFQKACSIAKGRWGTGML